MLSHGFTCIPQSLTAMCLLAQVTTAGELEDQVRPCVCHYHSPHQTPRVACNQTRSQSEQITTLTQILFSLARKNNYRLPNEGLNHFRSGVFVTASFFKLKKLSTKLFYILQIDLTFTCTWQTLLSKANYIALQNTFYILISSWFPWALNSGP